MGGITDHLSIVSFVDWKFPLFFLGLIRLEKNGVGAWDGDATGMFSRIRQTGGF